MSATETVEEFLARGGQIDTVPRGAMAEAGWTPEQRNINSPEFKARQIQQRQERTATVNAEIAARKVAEGKGGPRIKAPPPPRPGRVKPAKPGATPYANRNGADGTKTVAILGALARGWLRLAEIVAATGQSPATVAARLTQLRGAGKIISRGARPFTLWALLGAAPPNPALDPSSEFADLTDLQLLAKGHETRELIRASNRLIVRIDREIKQRSRAARAAA